MLTPTRGSDLLIGDAAQKVSSSCGRVRRHDFCRVWWCYDDAAGSSTYGYDEGLNRYDGAGESRLGAQHWRGQRRLRQGRGREVLHRASGKPALDGASRLRNAAAAEAARRGKSKTTRRKTGRPETSRDTGEGRRFEFARSAQRMEGAQRTDWCMPRLCPTSRL